MILNPFWNNNNNINIYLVLLKVWLRYEQECYTSTPREYLAMLCCFAQVLSVAAQYVVNVIRCYFLSS